MSASGVTSDGEVTFKGDGYERHTPSDTVTARDTVPSCALIGGLDSKSALYI